MAKMTSENIVLPEAEFCEFKRFYRRCGFDLCYFSPEIAGSKENIERHQFDNPKVIKLIGHQLGSIGISYDVAEYEQKSFRAALPELMNEFLKCKGLVGALDSKPDQLDEAARRRKWTESWVFFRSAATSMSAGILLVLVPSAGAVLPFVGFLLFLFSLAFLFAEWIRLYVAKWRNSREKILWFGERMTPVFIIVSVASILLSGVKIIIFLNSGTEGGPLPTRTWELIFYSKAFIGWLIFFVITLAASVFQAEREMAQKRPLRQKLKRIGALSLLAAGVIGVIKLALTDYFINASYGEIFVLVSIFLLMLVTYYLLRDEDTTQSKSDSMRKTR